MAKQDVQTSNSPSLVNRFSGIMRLLELERAFLIFSIIYFPVAWLFLHRGILETAILLVYTIVLALVAVLMIAKFVIHLSNSADNHNGNYGSLFSVYVFDALLPLFMLKALGHLIDLMLPVDRHMGIVCDLVRLFRSLYYGVFSYQYTLSLFIAFSLVVMFVFTVWSVGKRNNN